jgi:acyl-CoA thioester hydrolase
MKHEFEQKVYYSDTDAYGVVWHGAYLRWLEMGRVELCEKMGHCLVELQAQNIALPVVNLNVRYKSSAKLNDEMIIETSIQKYTPLVVTFEQKIMDKTTQKIFAEASVEVVAIDNNGKLYRKMPQILLDAFELATVGPTTCSLVGAKE